MIRIGNIRAGFATNSSSSHSILILRTGDMAPRDVPQYDSFGWDRFTLASSELKRSYLASQLAIELGIDPEDPGSGDPRSLEIISDLFGPVPIQSIDHQSHWSFPFDWHESGIDLEFARALADFVDRREVVILGGNDNLGEHTLSVDPPDGARVEDWTGWGGYTYPKSRLVARPDYGHWTLFNRDNGMKIRLSMTPDADMGQASAPELVDVKITDYCPFDCSFCYQGSTQQGKHASWSILASAAKQLGKHRVFEAAIGGGEPTLHPRFLDFCQLLRKQGVVPNFTTRNLGWLKDNALTAALHEVCGSFAYSVIEAKDVDRLNDAVNTSAWGDSLHKHPNVHVVMGSMSRETFREVLSRCNTHGFRPTLLGWKTTGRGQGGPAWQYIDWWRPEVEAAGWWKIGVDTTLLQQAAAAGQLDDIPKTLYSLTDGVFSGYLDLVNGTVAPSSWEPSRGSRTFDDEWVRSWKVLSGMGA